MRAYRQAECLEDRGCLRAREKQADALGGDVGEFDVVHDDEVVEVDEELLDLIAAGLEQEGVFEKKGGEVALDAALGVEHEVVATLAGGELLDGVGDHAVEPAQAVGAGDANPAGAFERRECGCVQQSGKLRVGEGRGLEIGGLKGGGHF